MRSAERVYRRILYQRPSTSKTGSPVASMPRGGGVRRIETCSMSKPVVEVHLRAIAAANGGFAVFLGSQEKAFVSGFLAQAFQRTSRLMPGTKIRPKASSRHRAGRPDKMMRSTPALFAAALGKIRTRSEAVHEMKPPQSSREKACPFTTL